MVLLNYSLPTAYNILEDTLARRTFDESGNYALEGFDLDIREHLISGTNRGIHASGTTTAKVILLQKLN